MQPTMATTKRPRQCRRARRRKAGGRAERLPRVVRRRCGDLHGAVGSRHSRESRSQKSGFSIGVRFARVRRRHRRRRPRARSGASASPCPRSTERLSHGSPTFFVRGKKTFVMFLDDHHGDGRLAIWCAAPPGVQAQLVEQEPRAVLPAAVRRPPGLARRAPRRRPRLGRGGGDLRRRLPQVAPKTLVAELDAPRRSRLMCATS